MHLLPSQLPQLPTYQTTIPPYPPTHLRVAALGSTQALRTAGHGQPGGRRAAVWGCRWRAPCRVGAVIMCCCGAVSAIGRAASTQSHRERAWPWAGVAGRRRTCHEAAAPHSHAARPQAAATRLKLRVGEPWPRPWPWGAWWWWQSHVRQCACWPGGTLRLINTLAAKHAAARAAPSKLCVVPLHNAFLFAVGAAAFWRGIRTAGRLRPV